MKYSIKGWGKGLNADVLASELEDGFCSDASNVRFRNGFAERVGGIFFALAATGGADWMFVFQTPNSPVNDVWIFYANETGCSAWDISADHVNVSPVGGFSNVTDLAVTTTPQRITGGVLNGILIVNSPADGLYYWAGVSTTKLQKVPGAYKARVSRPFGNYIVQIVPTINGTEYTRRLAWSSAADPGSIPSSFTASSTNDAGDVELADGGDLVDCLPLGDENIIYTNDGRWAMRYVGGNEVFSFTKLPGTDGLLYRNCVVDTPVGHVFLTRGREVVLHTGGACRSLSAGRVNSILQNVNAAAGGQAFLVKNPSMNEVWVCFKTTISGAETFTLGCDRVLIWNWVDDTWGTKTLVSGNLLRTGASGVPGHHPFLETQFVANNSGSIGITDHQPQDFTGDFGLPGLTAMIERKGLDAGDADVVKNLQRSRWNFDASSGDTFQIYHGSHMTAAATPTYASPVTCAVATTDYVNARAVGGRFLAVKATWSNIEGRNTGTGLVTDVGKVRSCDLDFTMGGKR